MEKNTHILVVEPDRERALTIIEALKDGGWDNLTVLGDMTGLARKMAEANPDLVLINLEDPSRDLLEQVSAASDAKGRPVAMFVDQSDDDMTQAAVAAGLSAYVVGALQPERIRPVLATAIARFQVTAKMRRELEAAKQALSDRKTIDRAKGVLMRAQGVTEDEAYTMLRRKAMESGRKVIDVAEALLTAADLLK